MKVAHFGTFSPNRCGQYESIKELIYAERMAGIDAQFIDYGWQHKKECRIGLKDGDIETVPVDWALKSDAIIRHSAFPVNVLNSGIPIIMALHGRPENSFRLEFYGSTPVMSTIMGKAPDKRYCGFITFWREHLYHWSRLVPDRRIFYVPPPVDLKQYSREGNHHDFGKHSGSPNIMIADLWREDRTPFNLVFAASYFKEYYQPGAKLHIYGVPHKKPMGFLSPFKKSGLLGEVLPQVTGLPGVYRSADMLITPNIIATRIIREGLASGLPMVAPHGCRYTKFQADPRDVSAFAYEMKCCWDEISVNCEGMKKSARLTAETKFNPELVGVEMKRAITNILESKEDDKIEWNDMSIRPSDWDLLNKTIDEYQIKRMIEFGSGISTQLLDKKGIRVHSYETMPEMIEKTQKQAKNTIFRLWDGKTPPELAGSFQMVLIDAPKGGENREPSYKAVAESGIPLVACHDVMRPEDKQWVDKYFFGWKVVAENEESAPAGLVILKRPQEEESNEKFIV